MKNKDKKNSLLFIQAIFLIIFFTIILLLQFYGKIFTFIFWNYLIPLTPIFLFISAGFWRNICPLSTIHQIPRKLEFSRNLAIPKVISDNSAFISILIFYIIVPSRIFILNNSPFYTIILLLTLAIAAFLCGFIFKGKSVWCTTICPMYSIEMMYGEKQIIYSQNKPLLDLDFIHYA